MECLARYNQHTFGIAYFYLKRRDYMGMKDNDKDIGDIGDFLETRDIKSMIYTIRGQQVMMDSDLAML